MRPIGIIAKNAPLRFKKPLLAGTLAAGSLAAALLAGPPKEREFIDIIFYDIADAEGNLTGGNFQLPIKITRQLHALPVAGSEAIYPAGDPANRVDMVFVGDGYTADELGAYANEVDRMVNDYFNKEPFARYATYFNVHRVDVVSNESGVDNDPSKGIERDTAMDMGFWCGNVERCICVDVSKAYSYAANAPGVDVIAAIANSAKYGGCGYLSANIGTTAGKNGWASEVILHEFGHALGNLADEYHYGDGRRYTGPEVGEPNVSIYNEAEMLDRQKKWWRWLGVNDPNFDGLVANYEGGKYSQYGIFRPTVNSEMNALGRQFNLPSVEALLIEIYKLVDPIDEASDTQLIYDGTETLFVTPLEPIDSPLDIQWYLERLPIPGANGPTLDLSTLELRSRLTQVSVTVTDNTPWVRDEAARQDLMTQTLTYRVDRPGPEDCLDLHFSGVEAGTRTFIEVYEGTPGATVTVLWGNRAGSYVRNKNSWCVDFGFAVPDNKVTSRIVATGTFKNNGRFFTSRRIPLSIRGMPIRFQAAEADTCPDPCMSNIIDTFIE